MCHEALETQSALASSRCYNNYTNCASIYLWWKINNAQNENAYKKKRKKLGKSLDILGIYFLGGNSVLYLTFFIDCPSRT